MSVPLPLKCVCLYITLDPYNIQSTPKCASQNSLYPTPIHIPPKQSGKFSDNLERFCWSWKILDYALILLTVLQKSILRFTKTLKVVLRTFLSQKHFTFVRKVFARWNFPSRKVRLLDLCEDDLVIWVHIQWTKMTERQKDRKTKRQKDESLKDSIAYQLILDHGEPSSMPLYI